MKFNLRFLVAIAVLVLGTVTINAQVDGKAGLSQGKQKAEMRHQKTVEKLGLSEEQSTEFKAIQKRFREELRAATRGITSKEQLADIKYENNKAKTSAIRNLLSPEQYTIFDTVEKKGKRGGKAGKGGKGKGQFKQKRKL